MSDVERVFVVWTARDAVRHAVMSERAKMGDPLTSGYARPALAALCPDSASVEDVKAAGSGAFWFEGCDACGAPAVDVVTMGCNYNRFEQSTASLCRACLVRAVEALDAAGVSL